VELSHQRKVKIVLSSAVASTSPVQAPLASNVGVLSPSFDTAMFLQLSTFLLLDYMTLTEIDEYSLMMITGDFNFDEYGPLGEH